MPTKRPKGFTRTEDGALYMRAKDTGIHQFIMLMDEVPITEFGKAKAMHVKLDDVIDWYERKAEHADPQRADEYREIAKNLRILAHPGFRWVVG